jgi:hypothetical protein
MRMLIYQNKPDVTHIKSTVDIKEGEDITDVLCDMIRLGLLAKDCQIDYYDAQDRSASPVWAGCFLHTSAV